MWSRRFAFLNNWHGFLCHSGWHEVKENIINFFFSFVQVDAAVLQYQNQKLVQQLDSQKHELQSLEAKIKELQEKQTSYDEMLITVNQLWNLVNCEIPLFPFYFLYTALFSGLSISCSLDCLMGNFAMLSL